MNITARPRQRSNPEYYVYYDDWTGEVFSVGRTLHTDNLAPYIVTQDDNARKIVQGILSDKNFIVSSDRHKEQKLVHKNEFLQLRKQEDVLFLLPRQESKDWDIRVKLFTKNNQLLIEINQTKITNLVRHKHRRIMLNSRVDFDFFIVQQERPDYLIKTIGVDAETLVNQGQVSLDVSDVLPYVNTSDIDILTRRYFENYSFEIVDAALADSTQPHRQQPWQLVNTQAEPHLWFTQSQDQLEISSNASADQLTELGLHDKYMKFHIVGEQPDDYLTTFSVNISKLRMGRPEKFLIDFDIMEFNVLFNNNALAVSKRKTQ